jgi:hypothetical protein
MVLAAKMPLPRAKRIVPVIVSTWNRRKGRIDEMTRLLDDMFVKLSKATPKQSLVLREIKTMAVSVYFAKRHCFPEKPVPRGQGFTNIQEYLRNSKPRHVMKEVLHELCTTYTIVRAKTSGANALIREWSLNRHLARTGL